MISSIYRAFLLILLGSFFGFGQPSTPHLVLPGLKDGVTIRRDDRDIPYIEAKNDSDLYFVQGYVTASDRLWQMDLMRRVARGESAEIFGKARLDEDKRWRRFGFAEIADQSLSKLTPELRSALDDYARGVNAFIATLDEKSLPVEFRILQYRPGQWSPTDTIVIGKILADALSTTWQNDLMRASIQGLSKEKLADLDNNVTPFDVVLFGKDTGSPGVAASKEKPSVNLLAQAKNDLGLRKSSLELVGMYAEELAASNNWVISGRRTADGKPILANDPHLAPSAPGIWYLAHLSDPRIRVSGVTFPGVPGIVLGHNENIAWGATNVGPDVQDLYAETFNEKGEYKAPSGWQKPSVRTETIKVRTNLLKTATETETFEVTETRNGPVILEDSGKKYALRWTALDPANNEFEFFFAADRARNWDEFKSALKKYGGAAQNFVYADTKGNIGWYAAGRVPIRRRGDGALPYDGSTSDGDWVGYIPFEELPNLYNPPDGLIVTANQRAVGTSYKYPQFARDAAPPWRARRIYDRLQAFSKITPDNVRDVQYDSYNLPLANLAREIVKLNAASAGTLAAFKDWDGRMTAGSKAALLANEIRSCMAEKIAGDNKPVPIFVIRERVLDQAVRDRSKLWLPAGYKSYAELMDACDASTRAGLADPKRLGPDENKWVWGAVFQTRFPHPLVGAPLIGGQFAIPIQPLDGSGQSPDVGSNVSMRFIALPGNWDETRQVIPLGESGDPKSPFFKNEFDKWLSGAAAVFPFSIEAVEKAAVNTTVFSAK